MSVKKRKQTDLIQREISELENVPNLWKTFAYCDNKYIKFETEKGFGGYLDWIYKNFDAKSVFVQTMLKITPKLESNKLRNLAKCISTFFKKFFKNI